MCDITANCPVSHIVVHQYNFCGRRRAPWWAALSFMTRTSRKLHLGTKLDRHKNMPTIGHTAYESSLTG
eukprot:jgi/Botrbrau1/9746/Bobra.0388s0033.1